jgi:hypothetical protein
VFEINCELWEYRQHGGGSAYMLSEIYIYGETAWSAKSRMLDLRALMHPGFMWGNTSYS